MTEPSVPIEHATLEQAQRSMRSLQKVYHSMSPDQRAWFKEQFQPTIDQLNNRIKELDPNPPIHSRQFRPRIAHADVTTSQGTTHFTEPTLKSLAEFIGVSTTVLVSRMDPKVYDAEIKIPVHYPDGTENLISFYYLRKLPKQ